MSLTLLPSHIACGTTPSGHPAVRSADALLALQYLYRQWLRWHPRGPAFNRFDLAHPGGGRGHDAWPCVAADQVEERLAHHFAAILRGGSGAFWTRFARQQLGYRGPHRPVTLRVPAPRQHRLPRWLKHLRGVQLKQSPNSYHPEARWLHGGVFVFQGPACRLGFRIQYSYRHESSSWHIGLDQRPKEGLSHFLDRLWRWLEPQIAWRHAEPWYHGFLVSADAMKWSELDNLNRTELAMSRYKEHLDAVFAWGKGAPGYWENDVAEALVRDASDQHRALDRPDMTAARLRTLYRWIREDRRRRSTQSKS